MRLSQLPSTLQAWKIDQRNILRKEVEKEKEFNVSQQSTQENRIFPVRADSPLWAIQRRGNIAALPTRPRITPPRSESKVETGCLDLSASVSTPA